MVETRPREIGFVLWGHCQNLMDDPRIYSLLNSAVSQNLMHIYHLFTVVINTKEFKNIFAQFKKICMHLDRHMGICIEKRIGCIWLKRIGNGWLQRIGFV